MSDEQSQSRFRVRDACARLVYELDIEANKDNAYFLPYTNYVMSWPNHIPINTIIIGQNPYPQNVYPVYGSAFAYDQSKCYSTQSVHVLARDIHNHDSTSIQASTECFRDSWRLLDIGVVLINETVYDKISKDKKNTRAIREMEAQCRALQVLVAESYFLGQTSVTCIGMGIPAACMTSIIRSWYPKDLLKMRVLTCKNPAARDIGDMPSHQITIGKTAVSKVLSQLVDSYSRMPAPRSSAQDKRRKQNAESLKAGSQNVSIAVDQYGTELQSFEDRLRLSRDGGSSSSTLDEILQSSGSLRRATDKLKNAIMSYNISLLMIVEAIDRAPQIQDSSKSSVTTVASLGISSGKPGGARRRIVRANTDTSKTEPVTDTPEAIVEETGLELEKVPLVPSPAPSRARRRPARLASYAPSNADTEYTIVSMQKPLDSDRRGDMSPIESVTMKSFANWCNDNSVDPVCYELLYAAAENKDVLSPLVQSLLDYIRTRKKEDPEYDAFDELSNPDSKSSAWARENIVPAS